MSGVEVLGLVFGAIPLLVSACEHFRDVCSARQKLFQFEKDYGLILRNIKDEELFFRMHLKKLLLPLLEDSSCDLDVLLLGPSDSQWKDHKVDDLLSRSLADGHERYLEILDSVVSTLHKLLTTLRYTSNPFQEKLNALKEAGEADRATAKVRLKLKANLKFRARHLDYVISAWNRDALLVELRENREKLEKILDDNAKIAAMHEQKTVVVSRRAVRSLLQHWQHANRVYDLIFKTCPCRRSHCAHLWLQHHESAAFELKLLVFFSPTAPLTQTRPWQQQGLYIQCIDSGSDFTLMDSTALDTTMSKYDTALVRSRSTNYWSPQKALIGSKKNCKRPKQSVRFRIGPSSSATLPDSSPVEEAPEDSKRKKTRPTPTISTSQSHSHTISEIHNLCKALAECGMESICIGTMTARENSHSYKYKVSSQPEQKLIADEISLYEVLHPSHRPRVPRAERFKIALKIASSHLKLHSTSWVRKQWECSNIKFPCSQDKRMIMTDKPFIDTNFIEEKISPTSYVDPSKKSFVCLGIMLLELLFGTLLEEHELWLQFGDNKDSSLLRLMVASQWVNAVEGEAGQEFAAIVKWCLTESPLTLQDERWRRDLADRVVLPLQKCCEWVGPIEIA